MLALAQALAYSVSIKGYENFCFTQKATENSQLSITYYCVEGGRMTVQATLFQNGKQLQRREELPSANFYIERTVNGDYQVCLYNGEAEAKQVTFFLQYTEATPQRQQDDALSDRLLDIQRTMGAVHEFQRQSQQVERRLWVVMARVRSSVKFWTLVKLAVVVACAACQVWSFKKYFGRKQTAV